jgi:hypothetical protein
MEVQDRDNMSRILEAVKDIRGQSRQLVLVRGSIRCRCEAYVPAGRGNSSISCEVIHRIVCKSPLHDQTFVLNDIESSN